MNGDRSVTLRLFGGVELLDAEGAPVRPVLAQPKRLALLIHLAAANPGHLQRKDTLLGLFWPEVDDARARRSLSRAIYFLRQSLPHELIVQLGDQEVGVSPEHLCCDVVQFSEAIAQRSLERALELYQGDLAPGFLVSGQPDFERWLEAERARLRRQAVDASLALALRAADGRQSNAAARWAERAAELAPLDEIVARRRIDLLDGNGDRAGALRAFDELEHRLRDELDIEPSPETLRLVNRVRARTVTVKHETPTAVQASEPATVAPSPAPVSPSPSARVRRFDPHPADRHRQLRGLPLAGFGRRAVALGVDFVLAGVLFVPLSILVVRALIALGLLPAAGDYRIEFKFFHNWYSVAWLVLFLGLSNHLGNGRTIGKRLLGIRAVSLVHPHLRGWPAFERALAYGASVLEAGFGFLQYFLHPNRQTVHDRIAETIVVDERPGTETGEPGRGAD